MQADGPGNPWFVTTLWIASYYIALAKNREELNKALGILEWVADHAAAQRCARRAASTQ